MWCPKLGKTLPKEQECSVYTLITCKSQFKKSKQIIAQPARSAQSAFYHDQCNRCGVQFTHVVNGQANLERQKNCLRDKSTQIPQDMLGTPTWQRTTRFQLRQTLNKDIYGYLWEPGEFSLFKRKPLSLIFGVRNNKFEYLIKHLISVRIK